MVKVLLLQKRGGRSQIPLSQLLSAPEALGPGCLNPADLNSMVNHLLPENSSKPPND